MSKLLSLLQLSDPALPIGGFAHSAGLETYVQQDLVYDAVTAQEFVQQQLKKNILYTDAAFVSLAFDAVARKDLNGLLQLDEECTAVKIPKELRQASAKMGLRLLKVFLHMAPHKMLVAYYEAIMGKEAMGHYCIVFGLLAKALNINKREALAGFFYNTAACMVTNSVKLIPLGQLQGQEILFSLQAVIKDLVQQALVPDRNLIGLCCPGFDLRCMQHERLYSRLYMS